MSFRVVSSATSASLRGEDRCVALENLESPAVDEDSMGFLSPISMFMVLDGHNGDACVRHVERELPQNFMAKLAREGGQCIPDDAVIRALLHAFKKTDEDFTKQRVVSGSAATVVVVDGSRITVGNVGDCECLLLVDSGAVPVTVSHRLSNNPCEVQRLKRAGAAVSRLELDGHPVGPVRLWPGGISIGRALGDPDVGPNLIADPDVMQFQVPPQGARLVIASDGLWDALPKHEVARLCRKVPTSQCPDHLVKSAIARRGLKDDISVMVVDLFPVTSASAPSPVNACPVVPKTGLLHKLRRTRLMDPLEYLPRARHSRIGSDELDRTPSTRRIVTVRRKGEEATAGVQLTTHAGRLYEQVMTRQGRAMAQPVNGPRGDPA